jgi:hypothetical protein
LGREVAGGAVLRGPGCSSWHWHDTRSRGSLRAEDEGRKGKLVGGVLFLKPHEAVAEAAETVGGEAAAAVRWTRQGGDFHCLRAVRTRSARGSYRAADGGPHVVLIFFNLTKTGSNLKFRKECLTLLQKIPNVACC